MYRRKRFLDWMDDENILAMGLTTVALMFGYVILFGSLRLFSVFDSVINVELVLLPFYIVWLLIWTLSFFTALLPFYIVWIVERRRVRTYLESE